MKPKIKAEELFAVVQAAWDSARGDRAMARRQDIDAIKIGGLLPYVGLIDVVHGERIDLRYRLVGAQTTQNFGLDLTGLFHSQHANPEVPSPWKDTCLRCIRNRSVETLTIEDGRNYKQLPFKVEARIWPLSDDDAIVDTLLGAALFQFPAFGDTAPNAR